MSQPNERDELDFRVVTPNTIDELTKLTKWTKEELWKQYRRATQQGTAVIILISDLSFQDQLDAAAAYSRGRCYYRYSRKMPHQDMWICAIHGEPGRDGAGGKNSRMPCEGVPRGNPVPGIG